MSLACPSAVASDSIPKVVPAYIAHVVVRTKNVKMLRDWYITVFQAEIAFENDFLVFLSYDDEHHRIAIGELPGLKDPDPAVAGVDHFAFSYRSIQDLLYTYERLKNAGIVPYRPIDHGMSTSLYYNDPDGNQVELQVDNFETNDQARAFLSSRAFAENPIGVAIDPDDLLARLKGGAEPKSLLSAGTGSNTRG